MAEVEEKVVFKRGPSSRLSDVEKVAGAVIITTDTGEMYVDDSESLRIQINADKSNTLRTARSLDGVSFNGSSNISHYGTCSTDAATAEKVVSLSGYTLITGSRVAVKFTVTNTASSPTLNVNSTGAKAIKYRGAVVSVGTLSSGRLYEFVYDGTDYQLVGDLNTDQSVKQNATITSAGEYPVLLGTSTTMTAVTGEVNKAAALTYNPSTGLLSCGGINASLDDGAID